MDAETTGDPPDARETAGAEPPGSRDLRALLLATSVADRVAYGLVAFLLLLAVAAAPLVEALEPRIAVTRAFMSTNMGTPDDPWGRPFLTLMQETPQGAPYGRPGPYLANYSRGPDGIDERGEGDDLFVLPQDDLRLQLASAEANLVFLSLGVALGGAWELLRLARRRMRAPWSGPGPEALQAGLIGIPAGLVGCALGVLLPRMIPGLQSLVVAAEKGLLIPFPLAVGGGAWVVVTLGQIWIRSQPAPEASAEPELPDRPCGERPRPPIRGEEGGTT